MKTENNTEEQPGKNKKASFWRELWLNERASLFITLTVYGVGLLFFFIMEILTRRLLNHPYVGFAYFGLTSVIISTIIIMIHKEKAISTHWRILCLNWTAPIIYAIFIVFFP